MKKVIWTLLTSLLILLGGSFILFVFHIVWLSPDSAGMMMGLNMLFHHMSVWMRGTFILIIIIVIIIIPVWLLIDKNSKDK